MVEVELKARIDDPEAVRANVEGFAAFVREFEKRDAYFHGADWRSHRGKKGFRVRSDGGHSEVTFKTKRAEGNIEINDERTFEVSDIEAFVELAMRVDCEPFFEKRKRGKAYGYEGITIEITMVDTLGWFIEIEKMLETDEPRSIALAQGEVRRVLSMTGVSESCIEGRSYSEMLLKNV